MVCYKTYIQSAKWRQRRKPIFERANGYCERCFQAPPREVHHRSYLHLGDELDSELMAVCRPCHKILEEQAGGQYGPRKPKKKKKPRPGKRTKANSPKWKRYQTKLHVAAVKMEAALVRESRELQAARARCGQRRAKEARIAQSKAFWRGK